MLNGRGGGGGGCDVLVKAACRSGNALAFRFQRDKTVYAHTQLVNSVCVWGGGGDSKPEM